MRIDSRYTVPARDDTASAIDHLMLKRLPKHARKAVLDPFRGTEFVLRERLSLMGYYQDVDRVKRRELRRSADFDA